ncbi:MULTISPECIES: response regulator [Agrobacterium]|uniref:KDP operon transcriptional regulatory protein KdpE n=1 Tax=Agrobacterium rosae TaxID=1972867 RepID=A0A1R3TZN3_9HYPH|nr:MULTISPECIES: response regulator [Agrobacterium]KAA3514483.1 response regulator [Agrobacterium rosae]KAA3523147.1 response regulator [Agrobacterium rosae]MBN7804723.1 response regulator [Agrobacterium rosae]MCM2433527.1 response regulator [Agrobacterium rosae]MDX8303350.1 response regulator [Agrobacterium rosae]
MLPQRVLIVEDEYLVAMDVETSLQSMGVETIDIATTLLQAKESLLREKPDCVLLDVSLSDGTSYELARHLREYSIPFGFVSGYGDTSGFPPDFAECHLLDKPFGEMELRAFVTKIMA